MSGETVPGFSTVAKSFGATDGTGFDDATCDPEAGLAGLLTLECSGRTSHIAATTTPAPSAAQPRFIRENRVQEKPTPRVASPGVRVSVASEVSWSPETSPGIGMAPATASGRGSGITSRT